VLRCKPKYTATHCTTLQHTATHCKRNTSAYITLQCNSQSVTDVVRKTRRMCLLRCVAMWCSVVQSVAMWGSAAWCSVVLRVAMWCSVVLRVAVWCSVEQCGAVSCSVVQYGAVCCSVVQCGVVWCNMAYMFVGGRGGKTYHRKVDVRLLHSS